MENRMDVKERYPDLISGDDRVGQEELGHTLLSLHDKTLRCYPLFQMQNVKDWMEEEERSAQMAWDRDEAKKIPPKFWGYSYRLGKLRPMREVSLELFRPQRRRPRDVGLGILLSTMVVSHTPKRMGGSVMPHGISFDGLVPRICLYPGVEDDIL
ncbi:hypothetical protein NHQ30_003798 [Ciborinia camelliae]|nr:hypothetical protein NHQ30_003798 [Ciborinia camelliae]